VYQAHSTAAVFSLTLLAGTAIAAGPVGYYRQPSLRGEVIVFVAEGDLWSVAAAGGQAGRLTTHLATERWPAISPDGRTIAFVAQYEGPTEVYTMPIEGGRPTRRTYGIDNARVAGWTGDDEILFSTDVFSTLPNWPLVRLDVSTPGDAGDTTLVPLAQAADGCYDDRGQTLYFTLLPFQGSHTKRYRGGTAQNIWRFAAGDAEATPLTADYDGTSKKPMWWRGRVYFVSDRDDTMNLWSMTPQGSNLRQHTTHDGWDVKTPSLDGGRIVYQLGADLHMYDIAAGRHRRLEITLETDLDQTREHWITEPMDYLTAAHLSPDGDRVVLTARGRVFVAPARQGRFVEAARQEGVRYRAGRFTADGEHLLALSDETGEVELWTLPANGVGAGEQLTREARVLRWEGIPSPDGRWVAHDDKNQRLFLYDLENKSDRKIDESPIDGFRDLAWSHDGKWLAYVAQADNLFRHIRIYGVDEGKIVHATTDRYDSYSPAWSPDGAWLYFLSDRNLRSIVGSPWGSYQPEPYLDKKTRLYHLALQTGLRSPFAPQDELHDEKDEAEAEDEVEDEDDEDGDDDDSATSVVIELDGLQSRLHEVPLPAGNYSNLRVNDETLFWQSRSAGADEASLESAKIARIDVEAKTIAEDVGTWELSQDGKKILLRKDDKLYIIDAKPGKAKLDKKKVDLSRWKLSIEPRQEWRARLLL